MKVNWEKMNGLVPAIVQDFRNGQVLMLGYMNEESLKKSVETSMATFYSRSKKCLWVKGETSGNYLQIVNMQSDCDSDTLLLQVIPLGPTCHLNKSSCFDGGDSVLAKLESTIRDRKENPTLQSYTSQLLEQGIVRIAQKVGEEGLEVALAAATNNDVELLEESADLVYHLLVLLSAKDRTFFDVLRVLCERHNAFKINYENTFSNYT